jgi:hypothetical protein
MGLKKAARTPMTLVFLISQAQGGFQSDDNHLVIHQPEAFLWLGCIVNSLRRLYTFLSKEHDEVVFELTTKIAKPLNISFEPL